MYCRVPVSQLLYKPLETSESGLPIELFKITLGRNANYVQASQSVQRRICSSG